MVYTLVLGTSTCEGVEVQLLSRAHMDIDAKKKVLHFLKTQKLAVISTINSSQATPESALIAYTEDKNLNLYFQTGRHTRKAQNLKKNPRVSLVVGLALKDLITIQYEGQAFKITKNDEIQTSKKRFIEKDSPTTKEYLEHPTSIFFKVTPTWIGYSDYSGGKPHVFELKVFS